jgi:hypothetical protein
MRRLLPIALGFAVLVFVAPAGASGPPVPDLRWRDCDGGFECATAKVPLDYDHPYGAKVRLAVVVRSGGHGSSSSSSITRSSLAALRMRRA